MGMPSLFQEFHSILIVDFGSQYAHLIARKIREAGIYCELVSHTFDFSSISTNVKGINFANFEGIILSGGPYSVFQEGAPHADKSLWNVSIPILGICYGLQEIAHQLGGQVDSSEHREYGNCELLVKKDVLFKDLHEECFKVWMSHGDQVTQLPDSFISIGKTNSAPYAAIKHKEKQIYGLQFHPEVQHTPHGSAILSNFAYEICGCVGGWSMETFIDKEIKRIQEIVQNDVVVGAVSGGVDSTVAAKLMHLAVNENFHAIFVNNGLLRMNEEIEVEETLKNKLGIKLIVIDASKEFLDNLKGIRDPEEKRKIIGNTFIRVFEREAKKINAKWLLQGTLYPDVIESTSFKGPSATIKTHHVSCFIYSQNVGGLLADMKLKLIEPLRELFKDEVRALGQVMGIAKDLIWRHPFPGPGLAIRILGSVDEEKLDVLKRADKIYLEEIRNANIYNEISQAFAVLLDSKSVGVMGDNRTFENVCALRAVQTGDFMTADWYEMPFSILKKVSTRIINEVKGINRVVYDISSKPPSTIEWE